MTTHYLEYIEAIDYAIYKRQPESSFRHAEGSASRTQIHWWELELQRNELTLHLLQTRF